MSKLLCTNKFCPHFVEKKIMSFKRDRQIKKNYRNSACVCMLSCTDGVSAVRISDRPKLVEPVCSTLLGHFPSKSGVIISLSVPPSDPTDHQELACIWLSWQLQPGCKNVVLDNVISGGPPCGMGQACPWWHQKISTEKNSIGIPMYEKTFYNHNPNFEIIVMIRKLQI